MEKDKLKEQYENLFPSEKEKAAAFDEIAREFYFCNFGTMQKSDIETLLFSLYLDQILDKSENDMRTYSDYILSKYLGITQNRISALKVRKELKYPYSKFDWKKSFARISENARYENGKIKINIPDKNLYYEIKNAIESMGGYIEVQLNSSLLQVPLEYFMDLMIEVSDEKSKEELKKKLKEEFHKQKIEIEAIEAESIASILKKQAGEIGVELIVSIMEGCISAANPVVGQIMSSGIRAIKNGLKQNK
ncbi:MAG: hypothetical protein NC092_01205 [Butyrivibrio sp.]|nr:hypothetical protein [Muribaculum sp.]MCM1551290.1 hypothetical protein [Butyrivibrio sp.]